MSETNRKGGLLEALHPQDETGSVRWTIALVWFLRIMAILWIVKGVIAWADILGVMPAAVPFDVRTYAAQTALVYFAVIDLIAAVGLWLASTWGGVIWLLALMSHLILSVMMPRAIASSTFTSIFFGLLMITYLAISWLAAREDV